MATTPYRQNTVKRINEYLDNGQPFLALRVALSTTPFVDSIRIPNVEVDDMTSEKASDLTRWLIALGDTLDAHIERAAKIEQEYNKLLAQRNTVREFLRG